ncbi:multiheme c-type cytochrome [Leptospira stimsonii]|nr:multiheme c-type cytochrome [Leptospira stimsonii]
MKFNPRFIFLFLTTGCFLVTFLGSESGKKSIRLFEFLRFENGIRPVSFHPESDTIRDKDSGRLLDSAADCKPCHKVVYGNWNRSRHKVAHTNEIYRSSFSQEPMQWCENCHSPLRSSLDQTPFKPEEGISCNVCHVRQGKILSSKDPNPSRKKYHEYILIESFGTEELCASCHQFNFPTWLSLKDHISPFEYSNLNMQDTVNEWRHSGFANESNCIDCHLAPSTNNTHSFRGGHSISELKKSLELEAEYVGPRTIEVRIISLGIGHSYPTGDLFRALRLKVYSESGKFREEFILRKLYRNATKEEKEKSNEPRILESDTRIPAPSGNRNSAQKEFFFEASDRPKKLKLELWIDYLNDTEKIFSHLKRKETLKKISSETIRIRGRENFTEKDTG